jgi:O-antigen/teichoic acid export membrane protein
MMIYLIPSIDLFRPSCTSIFNAGCGFFFWMIAARLYTVEQVGVATALISALGLVVLFSRLGFDYSIIRFFSSEDQGSIIGTSLVMTTGACLLTGVIYIMLLYFPSFCPLALP